MLGCNVVGYIKSCGINTGGVETLLIADANDFDWTSGASDADGNPTGYEAIARHAGATASDAVGSIAVGSAGTGYTTPPTVTFTGGGGSGAAATASVSGGLVTGIIVTAGGTGYTTPPTIGFTGGGGTGATATAALSSGGAYFFKIDSVPDQIGVDIAQANADGSTSSYEYTISARLAQMSQALTNFNAKLDGAAQCCQMLFVWRNNDGKIFVVGEKYVDDDIIVKFSFRQDGSKISTGKKFTDFNGEDLSIKGSYSRKPYEFTGGWSAISAFMATL